MPTFIDESGDIGGHRGSRYFRLAGVWFETGEDITQYQERIIELKKRLNLSQSFEFHFAKIRPQQRIEFFQALDGIPFNLAFFSLEKHTFPERSLDKTWVRDTAVGGLVKLLESTYLNAESTKPEGVGLNEPVKFDKCDDPAYERCLKEWFRTLKSARTNKSLIGGVKPVKSKSDMCVQLADMLCGAMGRYAEGDYGLYEQFASGRVIHKEIYVAHEERAVSL